jgi:hypothetical protein
VSALKLKNKFDQVIYTGQMPIIKDVKSVYSHSEGFMTGTISLHSKKVKVSCTRGLWRINE